MTRMRPALAAGLVLFGGACAGPKARLPDAAQTVLALETRSPAEREPRWQDALGARPDLLISLRPKALREDRVYGPLFRLVLRIASQRSRVVAGTRVLEAMEEADQVIATVSASDALQARKPQTDGGDDEPTDDIVAVVRGVRSDLDPAALIDGEGHALWSAGPYGRVRELVHERDDDGTRNPASLFELPGRTWVIASGVARTRARDAFARPLGRPEPWLDPATLAVLRIDGPSLVARIPALRSTGALASVGGGMQAVAVELAPGVDREIRTAISYADGNAAAASERALHEMKDVLARKKPPALAWFASATVEGPRQTRADADVKTDAQTDAQRTVRITTSLPPGLVDNWIRAMASRPPFP